MAREALPMLNLCHNLPRSQNNRRYFYNFRFFEHIDTIEKAYWLGFLMADGTVCCGRIQVGLAKRDVSHLYAFAKAIGFSDPNIQYIAKTQSNLLTLSCRQMTLDLANHGCLPRKTYKMNFPTLRSDLVSHFIRGFFDGDGAVVLSRRKTRCCVTIVGLKNFLLDIQKTVGAFGGIYATSSSVVNSWQFTSKANVQLFYDYLYKDATISLERKKILFDEYFLYRLPERPQSSKYIGVSFNKARNKWRATASKGNRSVWLGRYETEELAHQARVDYDKQNSIIARS